MKCIIPGPNVKVFGRAIHTLCRIGDELFMQCDENDALLLRTVNMTRSAFALIKFHQSFFTELTGKSDVFGGCHDNDANTCKVLLKACLFPFRSLTTLDKTVERCRICVDFAANELNIYLDCRHKIDKSYVVPFIVSDNVQAVYSVEDSVHQLQCDARMMHEAVQNFQPGHEEVTISIGSSQVLFNNYIDDDPDPVRSIQTVMRFNADDFDVFITKPCDQTNIEGVTSVQDSSACDVGVSGGSMTGVTFCLRDFRAVLGLAEALRLAVGINFNTAGRPIIFCVRNGDIFDAHFVLATLAERPKPVNLASDTVNTSRAATLQTFSDSIDESAFEEIVSPASCSKTRSVLRQDAPSVSAQIATPGAESANQPSNSSTDCGNKDTANVSSVRNVDNYDETVLPPEFADGEMDITMALQDSSRKTTVSASSIRENASMSAQNVSVITTSAVSRNVTSATLNASSNITSTTLNAPNNITSASFNASNNISSVTLNASSNIISTTLNAPNNITSASFNASNNITSATPNAPCALSSPVSNVTRANVSQATNNSRTVSTSLANEAVSVSSSVLDQSRSVALGADESALFAVPNSPMSTRRAVNSSRINRSSAILPHATQILNGTLFATPQKSNNTMATSNSSKCDIRPVSDSRASRSRSKSSATSSNIFTETLHLPETSGQSLNDFTDVSHPALPELSDTVSLSNDRPDAASVANVPTTQTRRSRTVCGPKRFSHYMFARYLAATPSQTSTATIRAAKQRILAANSDSDDDSGCTL